MRNISLEKGHDYPKSYSRFLIREKTGIVARSLGFKCYFHSTMDEIFVSLTFFSAHKMPHKILEFILSSEWIWKELHHRCMNSSKTKQKPFFSQNYYSSSFLQVCALPPELSVMLHSSECHSKKTINLYGLSLLSVWVLPRVRKTRLSDSPYLSRAHMPTSWNIPSLNNNSWNYLSKDPRLLL